MARKRTNPVWVMSKEEFSNLIESSSTITEVIKKMELYNGNSSTYYRVISKRIREDGLNKDHLIEGARNKMAQTSIRNTRPFEEILVENSSYSDSKGLKKRLIKANMIQNKCEWCGIGPEWNNKPLTLQLDHINGIHDDNRRENLRLLCPNCHTQTETHSGANRRAIYKMPKADYFCLECNKSIDQGSKSGLCHECWSKTQRRVERPSKNELEKLVETNSYSAIGRMYSISDKTVKKWANNYGLPSRKAIIALQKGKGEVK